MDQSFFQNILIFIENSDKTTGSVVFVFIKIISIMLFFPGIPLTVLSGVIFGVYLGSMLSILGNILGATLAFLLSRYFFYGLIQAKVLPKYPGIQEYEEKLFKNGLWTVVLLRLIPLFPFNGLNLVLAVTKVSFRDYFLGSLIGIIPGTIAFVYFGESLRMFSVLNIIISLLTILALIYFGKFLKK